MKQNGKFLHQEDKTKQEIGGVINSERTHRGYQKLCFDIKEMMQMPTDVLMSFVHESDHLTHRLVGREGGQSKGAVIIAIAKLLCAYGDGKLG